MADSKSDAHWYLRCHAWARTRLGRFFLAREIATLKPLLSRFYGANLVHIGILPKHRLYQDCGYAEQCHIMPAPAKKVIIPHLISQSRNIALGSHSVEMVIIQHALEFSDAPHEVLREAHRILDADGRIIICGFNPYSVWGLWRLVAKWFWGVPWSGRFIGIERVKDWLTLLGFDEIEVKRFFYRPPIPSPLVLEKLSFLEKLSNYPLPVGGAGYVIVAKKRTIPLTPIKPWSKMRERFSAPGLVQTSTQCD